jgi:hypothetical protein
MGAARLTVYLTELGDGVVDFVRQVRVQDLRFGPARRRRGSDVDDQTMPFSISRWPI